MLFQIYALNKIMQALEESNFNDFIKSMNNHENDVSQDDKLNPETSNSALNDEFKSTNFGGV